MPRLVVVYDTNVYRSIGHRAFAELRSHERGRSILGYANYGTVREILSHLAEPESEDAAHASAAAARLVEHCTEFDGSMHVVRFMASPMGQVTRYLFGRTPATEEDPNFYGALLGGWVRNAEMRPQLAGHLQAIAAETLRERQTWVETLWETVVKTVAPDATVWSDVAKDSERRAAILQRVQSREGHQLLARGMLQSAAAAAGHVVAAEDEERLTKAILENFRIMIEYRHNVISDLIVKGPDMSRRVRSNGVFDQIVCGATGAQARVRGCPVVLVTDDREILRSARASGMELEVIMLAEYWSVLETTPESFAQHARRLLSRQDDRRLRSRETV